MSSSGYHTRHESTSVLFDQQKGKDLLDNLIVPNPNQQTSYNMHRASDKVRLGLQTFKKRRQKEEQMLNESAEKLETMLKKQRSRKEKVETNVKEYIQERTYFANQK